MSQAATAGRLVGVRRRRRTGSRSLGPYSAVGLGVAVVWFTLLVLIPLAVVVGAAAAGGAQAFWAALANPQTLNAIALTVGVAVGVAAFNAVIGTVIAWVLVRDDFRGKAVLNVVIDIPFALPTIVAGLVLL
ncbi:MAG: molybdate ABC transporter permease subunit, partial [Propionicimonas sp.]